jgi:hypothetical protein
MNTCYRLKVILKKSKPPVWMKVLVPGGITFSVFSFYMDLLTGHEEKITSDGETVFMFEHRKSAMRLLEDPKENLEFRKYDASLREADTTFIDDYFLPGQWVSYWPDRYGEECYRIDVEEMEELPVPFPMLDRCSDAAYALHGKGGEWEAETARKLRRYSVEYKNWKAEDRKGSFIRRKKENTVFPFLKRGQILSYAGGSERESFVPGTEDPVSREDNIEQSGRSMLNALAGAMRARIGPENFLDDSQKTLKDYLFFLYGEKLLEKIAEDTEALSWQEKRMSGVLKKGKEEWTGFLARKIAERILSPEMMKECLMEYRDEQIASLRKALAGQRDGTYTAENLKEGDDLTEFAGELYMFRRKDCTMPVFDIPTDFEAAFSRIDSEAFHDKRRQHIWLKDCLDVVVFYYGAVPVPVFYRLYKQFGTLPKKEMIQAIRDMGTESPCRAENGRIIHEGWLHDDEYLKLEEMQGDKPYYIPSKAEVEDLAVNDYPSMLKEARDLLAFCRKDLKMAPEEAEDFTEEAWNTFNRGETLSDAIHLAEDMRVPIRSQSALKRLADLLVSLSNHTCMLYNRGYSPLALRAEISGGPKAGPAPSASYAPEAGPEMFMKPSGKIYPNDPCPCGSGKKYKKCCGRNRQ